MSERVPFVLKGNPVTASLRNPRYGVNLARRVLGHDRRSWFYFAILYADEQHLRHLGPPVNYYEFGTGWGQTLSLYLKALKDASATLGTTATDYRLNLFDSFQGLPPTSDASDINPGIWKEGSFSHPVEEIRAIVRKEGLDPDSKSLRYVKGFFEQSLTPELRVDLTANPPGIVTMDCDYYSSTRTVLEWLRPMLGTGTLFYFDDIWAFGGSPLHGERRAISEFNAVGEGILTPLTLFPMDGPLGRVFIYSRKEFEYRGEAR